jgi:hypothetical protein
MGKEGRRDSERDFRRERVVNEGKLRRGRG